MQTKFQMRLYAFHAFVHQCCMTKEFLKKPDDKLTPDWTVDPKDLNARCFTCKQSVPGGVDGLIKHLQKAHGAQPPRSAA